MENQKKSYKEAAKEITDELKSVQRKLQIKNKKKNPADKRPPKDWWDRCVASTGKNKNVDDPAELCGWIYYHGMGSDPDEWKIGEIQDWWDDSAPDEEQSSNEEKDDKKKD